jgi:hypothetical protein
MLVGDPSSFAIETEITEAYERVSIRALGYFLIHIDGLAYGIRAPDATCLACSFDEVVARVKRKGCHHTAFARLLDSNAIATGVVAGIYADGDDSELLLGMPRRQLTEQLSRKNIVWAPDGDQAFDDGSVVLHFDVDERVRLIGFRIANDYSIERGSLREHWMSGLEFYGILERWIGTFEDAWSKIPKTPETGALEHLSIPCDT